MSSVQIDRHRAFQLRLNPLTGESEWVIIDEEDDVVVDKTAFLYTPFLATSSYLDMLNDSSRNSAFRLAIEKVITGPCHILDIGAGTGLLSMMAARAMMESSERMEVKVSACESYLPMGKLMRKILRTNGMESMVKLYHKRSDELQVGVDLDCRASLLVSEILDSELLGEGLIPTLQHAHDMLLTADVKTVPYRATTYGQLIECPYLWKLNDLHGVEAKIPNGINLCPAGFEKIIQVKPQQHAMHLNSLSNEIHLLSEPFKIFEIEFWKRPDSLGETEMWIKPTDDGKLHALVTWWVLQLDCEGAILYSTEPDWIGSAKTGGAAFWRDHWRQCVWFVPPECLSVSRDSNILFKAVYSATKVSYVFSSGKNTGRSSLCSPGFHISLSPERLGIYGDMDVRSVFVTAVKNAFQCIKTRPLCVVADDSILLTVLAASLSKTSKVISSFHGLQWKGYTYLEAISIANGFSMDQIQVLNKRVSSLRLDDTLKIDLLLAEPFYFGNEGMLPWQNLRFWKDRSLLDPILSKDAIILPCKGILKVCAMYLPDIWRSRCCLEKVEGFDHSIANETLGACGNFPSSSVKGTYLPYFIWQCGKIKELSKAFSMMEFDFSKPMHSCLEKIKMEFSEAGICHGFVMWIDWVLDEENSLVISTGPVNRYWKQGVKLLSRPLEVHTGTSLEIKASFCSSSGELLLEIFHPSNSILGPITY